MNDLDGVNLNKTALFELHTCLLRLLDAGREATETTTGGLERFDNSIDDEVWSWQIKKDCVCFAIEIFWKAITANVAMLHGHVFAESMTFEFFSRLLNSAFVEVECEEMT